MKIKSSKGLAMIATFAITAITAVAPYSANAADLQTSFVTWGQNSYGQTGNGTSDNVYQPAEVEISGLEAGEKIAQIDADYYNTCAITTLGNLYCWGYNGYGGVATGDENTSEYLTPQKVSFEGKTWKQISVGYDHVCAIATTNQLYCWGNNSYGQVGDGTSGSDNYLPALVDTSGALSGKVVKQVAAAGYFTCALTTDNSVSCWGYAYYGAIGNNSSEGDDVLLPIDITNSGYLNGKTVKELVPGGYHMCALTTANDVACWGGNDYLETGTASQESGVGVPTQIDLTGAAAGKKFK